MVRCCWSAFFYFRPTHSLPPLDGRFIALDCSAHRSLATPAQGTQNPPHMSRMKLMSGLPLDQIGYPPGGPQRSAISQRLGTLLQAFAQFLQLDRLQAGLAARSCSLAQRLGSLLLPGLMPATDRLAVNAQSPGDLALMETSIKKPGGLESPPFQFIKIAFDAFWVTHAQRLTRGTRAVTILCETQ